MTNQTAQTTFQQRSAFLEKLGTNVVLKDMKGLIDRLAEGEQKIGDAKAEVSQVEHELEVVEANLAVETQYPETVKNETARKAWLVTRREENEDWKSLRAALQDKKHWLLVHEVNLGKLVRQWQFYRLFLELRTAQVGFMASTEEPKVGGYAS